MTRPKEQKQGSIEQGSLFNSKIKVNEQNKKILLLAPLKPIKAQIDSVQEALQGLACGCYDCAPPMGPQVGGQVRADRFHLSVGLVYKNCLGCFWVGDLFFSSVYSVT